MFDNIFAAIEKWMRELLSGMVESNLSTMFTAVNQQTSEIAAQVGQTPQGWNSSIFSMIRNISDSVVIPIAGIIITLILCYELISMLTERNNLHDVDTWMFFKYFVKMWIAVYLVSHTFDIAMAVFDIGQSVVNSSSGIIRGNTAIDISSLSMQMQAAMATMAIGELVTLALETLVVSWCLKILSVVITVIMYGRMIEIYLYTSLAPIPFATMSNREWGHVGTNYFRGLFALAFQAFLMMVCVAIYAALIGSIRVSSDIHSALFGTMAYTVILCFDTIARKNMNQKQTGRYDAYNLTYGNRPELFGAGSPTYSGGTTGSIGTGGAGGSGGFKYDIPSEALSDEKFARMIEEAEKYLGMPYVWGGSSPSTSFDCSGFVCWVINNSGNGWSVGRTTANGLRGKCSYVSPADAQPGDLIFFEKTYNTAGASHVGIYVGNGMMIHCGDPISYTSINSTYWQSHFLGFGRIN